MISKYFPALRYNNLANIITTLVIVLGFISAILMTKGELMWSFTCFFLAIGGDTIDGVIARRLKQSSPFGIQLDSLADAVSFSFLPAFLSYHLGDGSIFSLICCSIFIAAGVWRLAYYNISGLEESDDGAYYVGVPTTIAATWYFILIAWILIMGFEIPPHLLHGFLLLAAGLMLSKLAYPKHGMATKVILFLLPFSMLVMWLKTIM